MHDAIDLQAYLRRIGWHGLARADMPTLQGIIAAHVATIPFENLNPLLGLPVELAPAALERKLVHEGRGGYCFEQNLLLEAALRAIGFEVSGLIARVLWTRAEDAVTPQTHMLLRIELAGESWLVDVGFGGQTLVGVLRLQADAEQATLLEPFRLVQVDGDWRMQSLVRGQWLSLYRFDLRPVPLIDYVVANHYVATHPDSNFVNHLNVARTASNSRLSLRDREFVVRRIGHEPERRTLGSVAEIRQVLETEFLIRLPAHPQLDRRLHDLPDERTA
jgi:N-hydroxyarylamine O-acetyltransferase